MHQVVRQHQTWQSCCWTTTSHPRMLNATKGTVVVRQFLRQVQSGELGKVQGQSRSLCRSIIVDSIVGKIQFFQCIHLSRQVCHFDKTIGLHIQSTEFGKLSTKECKSTLCEKLTLDSHKTTHDSNRHFLYLFQSLNFFNLVFPKPQFF